MTEATYLKVSTPTFESYQRETTSFSEKRNFSREIDKPKAIENYRSSPKQFRPFQQSPDILSTKVCVELDLVASSVRAINPDASPSIQKTPILPAITITPDEAIAKLLEDPSTKTERQQPEGREKASVAEASMLQTTKAKPCKTVEEADGEDKLDGMLHSISHDLDYLLNRSADVDAETVPAIPSGGTFRRISKPPAPSIIEEIQEENEEDVKVPEAITEVLRTSC